MFSSSSLIGKFHNFLCAIVNRDKFLSVSFSLCARSCYLPQNNLVVFSDNESSGGRTVWCGFAHNILSPVVGFAISLLPLSRLPPVVHGSGRNRLQSALYWPQIAQPVSSQDKKNLDHQDFYIVYNIASAHMFLLLFKAIV